jgi:hypothetical protein
MVSYAVMAEIRRLFPAEQVDAVLALVGRYGELPSEREVPRVQLAILKIVRSDFQKLEKTVALAKQDYRDVLMVEYQ